MENVVVNAFAWSQLVFFGSVLCAVICLTLDVRLVQRWDEVRLAGRPLYMRRSTWIGLLLLAGLVLALQTYIATQVASLGTAATALLMLMVGAGLVVAEIGQIVAFRRRFDELDEFYRSGHQIAHS